MPVLSPAPVVPWVTLSCHPCRWSQESSNFCPLLKPCVRYSSGRRGGGGCGLAFLSWGTVLIQTSTIKTTDSYSGSVESSGTGLHLVSSKTNVWRRMAIQVQVHPAPRFWLELRPMSVRGDRARSTSELLVEKRHSR